VSNENGPFMFSTGDFLLMDADEEHYFETPTGVKMLEIRYR